MLVAGEHGGAEAEFLSDAVVVHPSQIVFVSNSRAGTVSQYTFNTGTGMLTPKAGPALPLPTGSAPIATRSPSTQ